MSNAVNKSTRRLRLPLAWGVTLFAILAMLFAVGPDHGVQASDHADPASAEPTANITDLFFFPQGDRYILIFDVSPALLKPPPYNLESYEYQVNMDLSTPVSFQDEANRARYGGTVAESEKIHADATVTVHLNNDATLKDVTFAGLTNPEAIQKYFGVRDDPFVFPPFFKKNIVAMVFSIPKSSFPKGQHDFLLWGTTSRDKKQIDHVGRSIRSQLPRFEFLNTLHPREQLHALDKRAESLNRLSDYLTNASEGWARASTNLLKTTFQIRPFDHQPDVMVYTDRFPVGYPNGRLLTDDVVALTCKFGDCLLQDLSYFSGGWPRQTVNDKPFSPNFPFLADPWPTPPTAPPAMHSVLPYLIGAVIVIALIFWLIVEALRRLLVWLGRLAWRRIHA